MKRVLMFAFIFSACGAAPNNAASTDKPADVAPTDAPAATPPHDMMVSDSTSLPKCTSDEEGWLVYLKIPGKFQVCTASAWADVDIKGAKGDAGKDGAAGKDGT